MQKPSAFHLRLSWERAERGWSQEQLAEQIGVDVKTVQRWELGKVTPQYSKILRLSQCLKVSPEELGVGNVRTGMNALAEQREVGQEQGHIVVPAQVWREVPQTTDLYGRVRELELLKRWIRTERCKVITVLGIGGVGKTSLIALLTKQLKEFAHIFWCSLHNALPIEEMLSHCIQMLTGGHFDDLPDSVDEQLLVLLQLLKEKRCLLILDNLESVLQSGQQSGKFREGYEGYSTLLQHVGERAHQSCLIVTSREKPAVLAPLEGVNAPVRPLHLNGVEQQTGQAILQEKGLQGTDEDWARLVALYSGNPLALKLAAETIQEVFAGHIATFLHEGEAVFGDITTLLQRQLERLSPQEQALLYWLAIEREPLTLEQLGDNLVQPISRMVLLANLNSLRRRSLIESHNANAFTLQSVIMEYLTADLVTRFVETPLPKLSSVWTDYVLTQAQVWDYVRANQERFLLTPVAQRLLRTRGGKYGLTHLLRQALNDARREHPYQGNYLAGNILNLLVSIQGDLHGFDFSEMVIWQAHLQHAHLHSTNFTRSTFVESTFTNTSGNVLSVAFSPLQDLLATGTATNEIWIYEASSGTPLLTCRGHTDGVWSVVFSPDSRQFVSSSDDQTIRVWDTQSGQCLKILTGHSNRVKSVAFSPDGELLASGSDDLSLRIWSLATGEQLSVLYGHTAKIWSVAFSPDGTRVATGSNDRTIRIWDVSTGANLACLEEHTDWVLSVAFSPDGKLLASGGDDRVVCLWDTTSWSCVKRMPGHTKRVRSVAFNMDSSLLASGSEDYTVRLWDVEDGACLNVLRGHIQGVRAVAFDPRGSLLASGADDQTTRLWDVEHAHCLKTLQGYTSRVWSVAFSPDGQMLLSGSEDQTIRLWNLQTRKLQRALSDPAHGVRCLAFGAHGDHFASGGEDRTVRLWRVNASKPERVLHGHTNWIRAIALSPSGEVVASGSEDQTIMLWDRVHDGPLRILRGHDSWIRALAFSPDGERLASCGDDCTVRIWKVSTGALLHTLDEHEKQVRSVAFSPDGVWLASAGEDQLIYLWNCETQQIKTLSGHRGWIRSIAFSPDGTKLVSGGEDQELRLWDLLTDTALYVLPAHTNRVRSVAFSPDGERIASGSDDGLIKLWNSQDGALLETYRSDRPYERMNITDVQGLTDAQKATLKILGAYEDG